MRGTCNAGTVAMEAAPMQALRHAEASIEPPQQSSPAASSGWLMAPTPSHGLLAYADSAVPTGAIARQRTSNAAMKGRSSMAGA
jgi:hypothetical protein